MEGKAVQALTAMWVLLMMNSANVRLRHIQSSWQERAIPYAVLVFQVFYPHVLFSLIPVARLLSPSTLT